MRLKFVHALSIAMLAIPTIGFGAPSPSSATRQRFEVSPFPAIARQPRVSRIAGRGGFPPIDDGQSFESALSGALAKCGARSFAWRNLSNEPPDAVATVEVTDPVRPVIACVSKLVRFEFWVRMLPDSASGG